MRVYAVAVRTGGIEKLSQEAYSSLEAAQRFIESRKPCPEKVREMFYQDGEGREYLIHDLLVNPPKKRQFWGVSQKYFDSGKVKVNIFSAEAETKPENGMTENKMCDEYVDYFETYEEAEAWAEQARKA